MSDRVEALLAFGQKLKNNVAHLEPFIERSVRENPWFLPRFYKQALHEIIDSYFSESSLNELKNKYALPGPHDYKVGIVMAGNIPLVGMQDVIHSYLAGYACSLKLSSKDRFVWPELLKLWSEIDPDHSITVTPQLSTYDCVIATGSDTSIHTLQQYFNSVPGIFRGHRNSVSVLSGTESTETLAKLNRDVFSYFGLGCRNISKIFVPTGYDFAPLMDALTPEDSIKNHSKYRNNYEYNYAMLVMNQVLHVTNGHLLMYENPNVHSRVSTVHFEYYKSKAQLSEMIKRDESKIQCITSAIDIEGINTIPIGTAQKPSLLDYADSKDTIQILSDWINEF